MKKKSLLLFGLGIVLLLFFFLLKKEETTIPEIIDEKEHNEKLETLEFSSEKKVASPSKRIENPYKGLIRGEFAYLKVDLPKPSFEVWEGLFSARFGGEISKEFLLADDEMKLKFLKKADQTIRLGLRDFPSLVPELLGTVIELVDDEDAEVSAYAALALYRLGDYGAIGSNKLQKAIVETPIYSHRQLSEEERDWLSYYTEVLKVAMYHKDDSLDEAIYQAWENQREKEFIMNSSFVDYGEYLERKGIELPVEYWESRMKKYHILAFQLLHVRDENNLKRYKDFLLFAYKNRQLTGSKILAASLLDRISTETEYSEFIDNMLSDLSNDYGNLSFSVIDSLTFLLSQKEDINAIEFLSNVTWKEEIAPKVLDGLSYYRDEKASDIIYDSAMERFSRHKFPFHQLFALVKQNTPYADKKYTELKTMLKDSSHEYNDKGSWVEYDFRKMEMYKKYEREYEIFR